MPRLEGQGLQGTDTPRLPGWPHEACSLEWRPREVPMFAVGSPFTGNSTVCEVSQVTQESEGTTSLSPSLIIFDPVLQVWLRKPVIILRESQSVVSFQVGQGEPSLVPTPSPPGSVEQEGLIQQTFQCCDKMPNSQLQGKIDC